MSRKCPVPSAMRDILEQAGVEWSWRDKRRHWQLLVRGRVVLTAPWRDQDACGRRWQNALSCVRRAARADA